MVLAERTVHARLAPTQLAGPLATDLCCVFCILSLETLRLCLRVARTHRTHTVQTPGFPGALSAPKSSGPPNALTCPQGPQCIGGDCLPGASSQPLRDMRSSRKIPACLNSASTSGASATGIGLHVGSQGFLVSPAPQGPQLAVSCEAASNWSAVAEIGSQISPVADPVLYIF